jgi:ABC-type nitrate/sulfonate/bicarbonate transport system permease component
MNASNVRRRGQLIAARLVWAIALPALLVAAWWYASADSQSFYFPPLARIVEVFPDTWFHGRVGHDLVPSLVRLLAGYLVAVAVGVALGVAIGLSRTLRALTEATLEFLRAMPPPVMVPVFMLFLGINDTMKVFVIATGALWPVLLNTIAGVRSIDEVLRDTSAVYRLRRRTRLTTLVLRGASPRIMTGARQALSIAIILMVISEMFAANSGLGFATVQFQRSFAINEMWTGIIVLGLFGVTLSMIFRTIERQIMAWYQGQRTAGQGGRR